MEQLIELIRTLGDIDKQLASTFTIALGFITLILIHSE